jgi:hypothetical protein
MSKARSFSVKLVVIVAAFGAAALAQACGSDEDDGETADGSGASGATGGTGATGNTGSGATGNTGTGATGGGAPANVDCPAEPGDDACLVCAQTNCAAEVMACCDQDAEASAMGELGCYDVVACARESACSGTAECLEACGPEITAAGIEVATDIAQPLGDCIIAAVDAGMCPDCMGAGGAGGGG